MTLAVGTRRYVAMLSDMTMLAVMNGVPIYDAVASAIETALADQAIVCDQICEATIPNGAVARWHRGQGSSLIRSVRPAVGVADEVPMSARSIAFDYITSASGGPAAERGQR